MGRKLKAVVLAAWFLALCLAPPPAHAGAANWVKVSVLYSHFDAAATTDTVTLYTTRGHQQIHQVVMRRDTDFAGGSITTYTVSVGKSGATSKYLPATDVFTGVSNGDTNAIVGQGAGSEADGTALIATATASHNCSTATAGKLTFYILVSAYPPGA